MISFLTDKGMVRSLNEDFVYYHEENEYKIYVVADGMGGHNAGEVASKMAAEGVVKYIVEDFNEENAEELLKKSIERVNQDIFIYSKQMNYLNGMGTTITACLEIKDKVIVANVGDSSCYGVKGNDIVKITKDHSLVQELVDLGTITELEAVNHPQKNIITRAVGTNELVEVDIFVIDKDTYDIYLLCSDGLTNEVTKEEMITIVNENKELISICEKLVNLAKYKGGRDNITVLLFGGER
ncbi:Stp1/IreP family PP2C-type Ser/Thr phosphatase [Clostridium sp. SHJSY1]|uniref:Stp1/IreP family PP2C-type Ser/Thr phosphatase n=1 Tax=Clostridium sp. SHJSY1 TaxID=2942483 RepID=UPI002876B589|nr:Stp1/IreP family PP2C-type Ser/Thr phosphatase [Clostridium sp. SHJSY1]MDS0524939.1 Stp1/IreP family PP2C-type Ser/Thr phosphatase [Clostridium sp. SHJSY1]